MIFLAPSSGAGQGSPDISMVTVIFSVVMMISLKWGVQTGAMAPEWNHILFFTQHSARNHRIKCEVMPIIQGRPPLQSIRPPVDTFTVGNEHGTVMAFLTERSHGIVGASSKPRAVAGGG